MRGKPVGVSVGVSVRGLTEPLPPVQRCTHRLRVRPLIALQHRLRIFPPAERAEIDQRGRLQLRGKLSPEAVPPTTGLRVELRELLAPLPPIPQEMPGDRVRGIGGGPVPVGKEKLSHCMAPA